MKMQEALDIINNKPKGFMVHFYNINGIILESDYFPCKHSGEKLIASEHEAWELADRFAKATKGQTCDIYVIGDDFTPVDGYRKRKIENR